MRPAFLRSGLGAGLTLLAFWPLGAAAQSTTLNDIAAPAPLGNAVMRHVTEAKRTGQVVDDDTASRIYGGRAAQQGAWPMQVSLHKTDGLDNTAEARFNTQFCGGSFITAQWILTAAHCVVDDNDAAFAPGDVAVRSGANSLSQGDMRAVSQVVVHEDYNSRTMDADIALLKLAQPVTQSSGPVGAIRVMEPGMSLPQGPAVVVGWGLLDDGTWPSNLMEVDIDVVSNATCNDGMAEDTRRELGGFLTGLGISHNVPREPLESAFSLVANNLGDRLTENMICAGTASGERDSCSGDSGGPLMLRASDGGWIQAGIVSWGRTPYGSDDGCGNPQLYGVYTRVSNYFNWIASHVQG